MNPIWVVHEIIELMESINGRVFVFESGVRNQISICCHDCDIVQSDESSLVSRHLHFQLKET